MTAPDTTPAALDQGRIRITREIPLWQILVALAAFAGQAVTMYFSQQRMADELARQGQRQVEMASDIRAIASDAQKSAVETMKLGFTLNNLEQRVRALESAPTPPPRR